MDLDSFRNLKIGIPKNSSIPQDSDTSVKNMQTIIHQVYSEIFNKAPIVWSIDTFLITPRGSLYPEMRVVVSVPLDTNVTDLKKTYPLDQVVKIVCEETYITLMYQQGCQTHHL